MKVIETEHYIIQQKMQNHKAGKRSNSIACYLKYKGKQIERHPSY